MKSQEFKVFNISFVKFSFLYGLFLFSWGILISIISNSSSITSYIPSFISIPIILFSFLSLVLPQKKKLFMHITATFGLICALAGLDLLRALPNIFDNFWADISKIIMFLSGSIFTYLCIKSFIFARTNANDQS